MNKYATRTHTTQGFKIYPCTYKITDRDRLNMNTHTHNKTKFISTNGNTSNEIQPAAVRKKKNLFISIIIGSTATGKNKC